MILRAVRRPVARRDGSASFARTPGCETKGHDARYVFMRRKKSSPMPTQPLDDGHDRPQPMTSRVRVVGPKQPVRHDRVHAESVRAKALSKQREALRT
jgi:hypothetical protein